MVFLFRLCAKLPLGLLQALGFVLGWLVYGLSQSYREQFRSNSSQAGYTMGQVRAAIGHAGRMSAELPRLWLGKPPDISWSGLEYLAAAQDRAKLSGRGIIFLTAHIGGFEMGAQTLGSYVSQAGQTLHVLYRPSRQSWMEPLVSHARSNHRLQTVPASLAGVKTLVKALRSGHPLLMAADQVPPQSMGAWVKWFGRPAYTMTLAARLVQQTQAQVLLYLCERKPHGKGFHLHILPVDSDFCGDTATPSAMNAALESLVRRKPEQYLWAYARYKTPRADKAPRS
jgi:Kdo2-lipid IVA lauroyltransferase/acyltransferase